MMLYTIREVQEIREWELWLAEGCELLVLCGHEIRGIEGIYVKNG